MDFTVKGTPFTKKTFYNTILATNICIWKYLADKLFDGDLQRIVWSSPEKMFKNRQNQLQCRSKNPTGLLDMPFVAFKLSNDGVQNGTDRPWFNQALNVEGMYLNELGRKLKMTPVTLKYDAVFCCQHDTDLHWAQQTLVWDQSNETLLRPVLETKAKDGITPVEIPIMALMDDVPQIGKFTENDWLTQNKIQAIDIQITVQTYLLDDNTSGFSLVKKVIFDFLGGAFPDIHIEGDVNQTLEEVIFTD